MAGAGTRSGTIRESSQLTGSFVSGTMVDVEDCEVLSLLVKYAMGRSESGNAVVLKVELSVDGTDFHCETDNEVSLPVKTYTVEAPSSPGTYDSSKVGVPVTGIRYAKVSAKETGVVSQHGTCEIKCTVGWQGKMTRAHRSRGETKRFCPVIRKKISGFQCQLYQAVEYKKAAACMSCPDRNEVIHGRRKQ